MQEMPLMASSSYASNQFNLANIGVAQAGMPPSQQAMYAELIGRQHQAQRANEVQPQKEAIMSNARRLVQVFIADPNENVPLDDCLLYEGKLKLTDLTDQELFFEIDVKTVLDAHNAKRVKMIDKKVKERVEHLEAARIRDLKMTVVTVAQF